MPFRTLEISSEAEIHIRSGNLEIVQPEAKLSVPIEDLSILIASGPNIRLSTQDISVLSEHDVLLLTINSHYEPSSMTLSFVSHSRQSDTMKKQLALNKRKRNELWNRIIIRKIENQAMVLKYLKKEGSEEIFRLREKVNRGDKDNIEAYAAGRYFQYYHPGLNRRNEDPVNSCLNYGYAVVRSAVARSAAKHGFLLSDVINHRNTFNPFNLVDDLMEPFRPMVDLLACSVVSDSIKLTREQRRSLMGVLYNECRIAQTNTTVIHAIDIMVSDIRAFILEEKEETALPELLPVRYLGGTVE
ncbi:MAG: type II CRISPR-associated endonuclease Cas1 [Erysipelotrichaceae bacterium]|nr:type II CRISPR-associated endonuclease Cas1 [Erysipelotrichaceae bacterium]